MKLSQFELVGLLQQLIHDIQTGKSEQGMISYTAVHEAKGDGKFLVNGMITKEGQLHTAASIFFDAVSK